MQSKWLEEQERIVNEFRGVKRKQFPMIVGMIFFMIALFGVIGFINSGTMPKENISIMLKTLGMVTVTMILVLLLAKRQNNKKGYANLRKSLDKLLRTQEEIKEFDAELMAKPLQRVLLPNDNGEYFFTEHYLVFKFGRVPLTDYSIFRLSEIDSTKTICLRDRSNIFRKRYFTNLCDKDRKVLGGFTISKRNQYEGFMEDLQRFVPDVKFGAGR